MSRQTVTRGARIESVGDDGLYVVTLKGVFTHSWVVPSLRQAALICQAWIDDPYPLPGEPTTASNPPQEGV